MDKARDRRTMRAPRLTGLLLAAVGVCAAIAPPAARATVQEESCIYPDVEYPMPCDDED
jgi:hypothetical protein